MPLVPYEGFTGGSYLSRSLIADGERSINLYPEPNEGGHGKSGERMALYGTPGLVGVVHLPQAGSIPLMYASSATQRLFAIAPQGLGGRTYALFEIVGNVGSYLSRGQMLNIAAYPGDPWFLFENPTQLLIVHSDGGYIFDLNTNVLSPLLSTNAGQSGFPAAPLVGASFIDGYFIVANAGEFAISNINNGLVWQPLEFATENDQPNRIQAIGRIRRELVLFGANRTEFYYDSGDALFPFSRVPGAVVEIGCPSPGTVLTTQFGLFFIGSISGASFDLSPVKPAVYLMSGYQPQRISTFAIENVLAQNSSYLVNAKAWLYQEGGHQFAVIQMWDAFSLIPAPTTLVYDFSTGLWHERQSLTNGIQQAWLGTSGAGFQGANYVGDWGTGWIHRMDLSITQDNSVPITRTRIGPPISGVNNRLFFNRFILDLEVGSQPQGQSQLVTLSWSNDGGVTFSGTETKVIGTGGNYTPRAEWHRLGSARSRVFKVSTTDAMQVAWINAFIDYEAGNA